jgi:hypothetical protein
MVENVAPVSTPTEGIQENASNGAQGTEPAPQYLTTDQVAQMLNAQEEKLTAKFQANAKEFGQRGAQAVIDKTRLKERVGAIEAIIDQQVQDGTLDEKQASDYKKQARRNTIDEMLLEEQGQVHPGETLQERAVRLVAEAGLTPDDPEYRNIKGETPLEWGMSLREQQLKKQARLAAAQQTPPMPSAPPSGPHAPPEPQVRKPTTAVEASGGGSPPTNLSALHEQSIAASRRGDFAEARRLQAEMHEVARPSP